MKLNLILILLVMATTVAWAAGHPQTHCPVMTANEVDATSPYVDVDGYRIYICCRGCAKAIQDDPAKYIAQLQAEGVELEKAPEAPAAE
ncbi:MAG TPA: hypothetical protein PLD40_05985 [Kiritimatiellia bacterium]|mgnify:FL=1|jgi:hypothetical protein|nr:hypothetical protein [Kiritimatiellia bacterium]OQC59387.1 MAG: hypothetical protein BWX54_00654 [Verrucomicrobia bacterium ADurb.Bin018]MBP9572220.1 hypothetical protein [Kiritimatiellia bacterium]HOE00508.1 hypothetical protein [Kiritimatiellia bacterium]HOE37008.1 hypothetical protein [Kiritimatiellia bacterium]